MCPFSGETALFWALRETYFTYTIMHIIFARDSIMDLDERFNVPKNHKVQQTSYKTKGTLGQNEDWEYDILDGNGLKVFTVKEWSYTNLKPLKPYAGFKKYDSEGRVVEETTVDQI